MPITGDAGDRLLEGAIYRNSRGHADEGAQRKKFESGSNFCMRAGFGSGGARLGLQRSARDVAADGRR